MCPRRKNASPASLITEERISSFLVRTTQRYSQERDSMRAQRTTLVGTSPAMVDLKAEIDRVARSDAKVLITGESGAGKELVALAVHSGSQRADRAFVAVN